MRRGLALALALSGVLVGAEAAQAGTVSKSGTTYVYDAGAADLAVQRVYIYNCVGSCGLSGVNDAFIITDNEGAAPPPTAAAGSGCTATASFPGYIQCPSAGITAWDVSLRGGNDTFQAPDSFGPMVSLAVKGSDGTDTIQAGNAVDQIDGGPGTDTLNGNGGDDVLNGGVGSDVLNGGGGTDRVTYAGRGDNISVELATSGATDGGSQDGAPGARDTVNASDVEGVTGGDGDDELDGSGHASPLMLAGGPGGDVLTAGIAAASLIGDEGNDRLLGGNAGDTLDAGPGGDTLLPDDGADTVRAGTGVDSVDSRDGVVDSINCGGNHDSLLTDPGDTLSECDDPAPPATPSSGGGGATAALQRILITPAFRASAGRASTRLSNFVVRRIPAGSRLTVRCRTKKKRCPRTKDFVKSNARGNVRVKSFEKKSLPVGATLEIRVTKAGMVGAVKVLTVRKGKKPSVLTRCLPPGAARPARC